MVSGLNVKITIAAVVVILIVATGLTVPYLLEQNQGPANEETPLVAEYRRITPQEAMTMMSGDVIILDVRTQEEFDSGHIKNAILLPDFDVREKAESVISDKNQTILVYCRSGRRSEAASRELVDLGYTRVYDFGGINDWTGEVVRGS